MRDNTNPYKVMARNARTGPCLRIAARGSTEQEGRRIPPEGTLSWLFATGSVVANRHGHVGRGMAPRRPQSLRRASEHALARLLVGQGASIVVLSVQRWYCYGEVSFVGGTEGQFRPPPPKKATIKFATFWGLRLFGGPFYEMPPAFCSCCPPVVATQMPQRRPKIDSF